MVMRIEQYSQTSPLNVFFYQIYGKGIIDRN